MEMKFLKRAWLIAASVAMTSAIFSSALMAQGVDASMLRNPPADSWPTYHGDYSGRRHSKLTQISRANVGDLALAWAFQTGQTETLKSSPLLVDGILYFTVPENVWAVDARSGHMIWHYMNPPTKGDHIGNRGVGMYKNWLYFLLPDGHLLCLDARNGHVLWKVEVADVSKGYWTTMAPLVVGDHVIIGVSGDFDNLAGYLRAIDPETGKTQWQWDSYSTTGNDGEDNRRDDLDDGHVRSRIESDLLGHGQSNSGVERLDATRQQPVHMQYRRRQSGYRQAGMGVSGIAARYA